MTRGRRGIFVVIEGADGTGKTSVVQDLYQKLIAKGFYVQLTCEPTQGPIGGLIRKMLSKEETVSGNVLPLLFAADRRQHQEEIETALDKGLVIISDRYYHSSFVYQSPLSEVQQLNVEFRKPDFTFVLDLPTESATARRENRAQSEEIFDHTDTQRAVREQYRSLPQILPEESITFIDATLELDRVSEVIVKSILESGLLAHP